jgi:hypothetical protein
MLCTHEHLGQIGPINQAQTSIFGLLLLLIYGLQKKKEKIKEGEENRTEAVRTDRNLKRSRMQRPALRKITVSESALDCSAWTRR